MELLVNIFSIDSWVPLRNKSCSSFYFADVLCDCIEVDPLILRSRVGSPWTGDVRGSGHGGAGDSMPMARAARLLSLGVDGWDPSRVTLDS